MWTTDRPFRFGTNGRGSTSDLANARRCGCACVVDAGDGSPPGGLVSVLTRSITDGAQPFQPRGTLAAPMAASDPFANLPALTTLVLRFRAASPQRLPPLPTTAFHGTLGHALRDIACLAPQRKDCPGCPHLPLCPYAVLFEPRPAPDTGGGVTNRAPPPIVIAPEVPVTKREPLILQQGDLLGVRLSLIGSAVGQHLPSEAVLKEPGPIARFFGFTTPKPTGWNARGRRRFRCRAIALGTNR